ncbi:MAG: hypothetical protein ACO25L_04980 [Candidatus Nanopelagicales bacterium]|jgi:hypothetical protein
MKKKTSVLITSFLLLFVFSSPSFAYLPKAKCKSETSKCAKTANTKQLRNFAITDNQHFINEHNYRVLGKISAESMAGKEYAAAEKIKKYANASYGVCKDLMQQMSNLYAARAATYFPQDQVDVRAGLNGQIVALDDQLHANCNKVKMRW